MESSDISDINQTESNTDDLFTDQTSEISKTITGQDGSPPKKFLRLPITRVKHIMKLDAECGKLSHDSVFLVTKATELFLEYIGRESAKCSIQSKRKTVQKRDVDAVIDSIPQLCFLEGALE